MATFINTPSGTKQAPAGAATPVTGAPQPTTHTVGGLNTLHYGGSISFKTGKLGAKPKTGVIYRKQARMELMVRLENANLGEAAIAAMLCISVPRLRQIKKSPEYLIARMQITHGIIVDNDARIAQVKEQRKEILTQMLPPALAVLANEIQAPAVTLQERRHRVAVAQDLLDREGTFAKISRTELKPVNAFEFEGVDEQSRQIISAIRGIAPPPATAGSLARTAGMDTLEDIEGIHTLEAVEANEAFSNSHTLSQTDQEKALAKLEEEAARLEQLPLGSNEIQ